MELLEGVSLSGAAEGTKSARGARRRQRRTESRRTRATNKPTSSRNEEQLITSFIECQELGAARDHRHVTQNKTGCASVEKVPLQAAPTISSALCPAIAVESLQLRPSNPRKKIEKKEKKKRKNRKKSRRDRRAAGGAGRRGATRGRRRHQTAHGSALLLAAPSRRRPTWAPSGSRCP